MIFAKDLFLRAVFDPYHVNEILEGILANPAAIPQMIGAIRFRPGAVHYLGGLVLWILDLSNSIFRNLLTESTESKKGFFYAFVLDRTIRRIWIDLLIFIRSFFSDLRLHNDHLKPENVYITLLRESLDGKNQMKVDQLLEFLLDFFNSVDTKVNSTQLLENERHLICHGFYHDSFSQIVATLQPSINTFVAKLFPVPSALSQFSHNFLFNPSSLFEMPRSHIGSSLDIILKTNIGKHQQIKAKCSRCRSMTQAYITGDESIHIFQVYPSWKNSYQDFCLCGGKWIVC
jgi:hypothetical protein